MDSSLRGASTAKAWDEWDTRNVSITTDGVTVDSEALPTYATERQAALPAGVTILDVALAPCGDPYLLTREGELYRYDPARDQVEALPCVWQATGDPRTLCVTTESIFLAGDDPGAVQAISRYALQTRWIREEGIGAPIALARHGGDAVLLDGTSIRGAAAVRRIGRGGQPTTIVAGLMSPSDLAVGPDDKLWVLDELVGTRPAGPAAPVIRRFEPEHLERDTPVSATDTVRIAPAAFQLPDADVPTPPTSLDVGTAGDLIVGIDPDWTGQRALLRYRPSAGHFERQPALGMGITALAAPAQATAPRAYAVDGIGELHVIDGEFRTRRNREGAPAGRLVNRFAASEAGVEWHRVELDRVLSGTETEVRVRYATTDADQPVPASDETWDAPPLESLDGLGSTYADRLRSWGVEDLADLAELSGAAVQPMVSLEERNVSTATVAEWQTAAQKLLDAGEPSDSDVETVTGIGSTYAARLTAGGIPDLGTLVTADTGAIARLVSGGTLEVPLSQAEDWVAAAAAQRPPFASYDELEWTTIDPSSPTDALFTDAVGRYCWIDLELLGTPRDRPTVRACRVEFPRDTYLTELPAIYREDPAGADFLSRYLSLFERIFTDVETATAGVTSYLDPDGIPGEPDQLAWLGQFLGMDVSGGWPTGAAREFIDRATELYRIRGTRRGLRTATKIYLDHVNLPTPDWGPARAQEMAQLDQLVEAGVITQAEAEAAREDHAELAERDPAETIAIRAWTGLACADDGPAREFYERLLGCPEGVLVLVHPRVGQRDLDALSDIVAAQEPAHASVRTVGLRHRLQLAGTCDGDATARRGYHTYLGVNSTLADPAFNLDAAGLGESTVLGTHEPDGQLDIGARLDADAHLS